MEQPYALRTWRRVNTTEHFLLHHLHIRPRKLLTRGFEYLDDRYPISPHPRFWRTGGSSPQLQQPGIQILATCRDLYEQGHRMLYPRNNWHIAPGIIDPSLDYFDGSLQRKHRDLIRSLTLTFNVRDLNAFGFLRVENRIKQHRIFGRADVRTQTRAEQIDNWTTAAELALLQIWQGNLNILRQEAWTSGVQSVTLVGGDRTAVLSLDSLRRCAYDDDDDDRLAQGIDSLFRSAVQQAAPLLRERFSACPVVRSSSRGGTPQLDVEGVKLWLHALAPPIRDKPSSGLHAPYWRKRRVWDRRVGAFNVRVYLRAPGSRKLVPWITYWRADEVW